MTRWFILFAACFFATSAVAQNTSVHKEIVGFKGISVNLIGNIKKCNVTDTKNLVNNLQDRLGEIGIKQDPESVVNVTLRVAGGRFGAASVLCNYSVNLDFQTWLSSKNIVNVPPRARAALDRMKVLPIVLWSGTTFGVTTIPEKMNPDKPGGQDQAEQAAIKGTTLLVKRFEELRK